MSTGHKALRSDWSSGAKGGPCGSRNLLAQKRTTGLSSGREWSGLRLKGRVALITGGGSGIGREAALTFAAEGAAIVVADLNPTAAAEVAALVQSRGGRAVAAPGRVDAGAGADSMVAVALQAFGAVDVVLHSAGIGSTGTMFEVPESEWDQVMAVNVKGTFLVTRAAAQAMIAAGRGGSIITIGSTAGLVGGPRMIAYNASKGAVVNMTRNMAIDLAPYSIRVNCLCPGTTLTPLVRSLLADRAERKVFVEDMLNPDRTMLGRFAEPHEIARAALFLASDDASYVTGSILTADGGFTAW